MITMGSLFSGIGGFEVAASWYGIKCLWQSEIEPWAVELLKERFPDAKQLGDICGISGAEIPPVDIITFGSPCQDMSVAGARKGMKHVCPECGAEFDIQDDIDVCPVCGAEIEKTRSGLFMEAIRIIREMRRATNGIYPNFIIWENVPGAFTSNRGMDFRAVLEEITETKIPMPASGRWANAGVVRGGIADVAWRVLDAQYWGVPQRRKRIYLVADYRGQRAGEILFKPEGVSRYPAPCGEAWKSVAADTEGSFGEASGGIKAAGFLYKNSAKARSIGYADELAPTLRAEQTPAVIVLQDKIIGRKDKNTGNGSGVSESLCYTLTSTDVHGVCVPVVYDARGNGDGEISPTITGDHNSRITDYTAVLCELIAFQGQASESAELSISDKVAPTIQCTKNVDIVAPIYAIDYAAFNQGINAQYGISINDSGILQTLVAKGPGAVGVPIDNLIYIVRRLTPSECAKVQGFPADWHKGIVNAKGKEMPDTATYRGYGNAVATVCAEHPIQGIYEILSKEEEQK